MSKQNDGMCGRISIGHLTRFSNPERFLQYITSTKYIEKINIWNNNISIVKDQKEDEEKLLQK